MGSDRWIIGDEAATMGLGQARLGRLNGVVLLQMGMQGGNRQPNRPFLIGLVRELTMMKVMMRLVVMTAAHQQSKHQDRPSASLARHVVKDNSQTNRGTGMARAPEMPLDPNRPDRPMPFKETVTMILVVLTAPQQRYRHQDRPSASSARRTVMERVQTHLRNGMARISEMLLVPTRPGHRRIAAKKAVSMRRERTLRGFPPRIPRHPHHPHRNWTHKPLKLPTKSRDHHRRGHQQHLNNRPPSLKKHQRKPSRRKLCLFLWRCRFRGLTTSNRFHLS
ncbi:uncharacterized protein EV422DRAFT_532270 [Fimicolochytrium jonesii]|uniref:uncharacterized protein n=1 Tax=Fimicolochytrium jonesii TaxID=1396493 RepID=UPI0022FE0E3D|nr:uncharacterized protein EV422DRAFT_532270 [Fimicolochytrium jonesii]KAI8820278.1 hypothetical protein EV422DRAFT_532270 [Fimicolochytrium jonesii]